MKVVIMSRHIDHSALLWHYFTVAVNVWFFHLSFGLVKHHVMPRVELFFAMSIKNWHVYFKKAWMLSDKNNPDIQKGSHDDNGPQK